MSRLDDILEDPRITQTVTRKMLIQAWVLSLINATLMPSERIEICDAVELRRRIKAE